MLSLNEQAYEHLRNMITSNQLSYHKIYSETKISKELGISRTPFRDAVHRLAQEGYIDIIPSKGFRLHQLSRQDVNETFQVRSALETYCTMMITRSYLLPESQALFKELHRIMEQMRAIMNTSHSIEEFCAYDFQFHEQIIHYLDNDQLSSIFGIYTYRMKKLALLSLSHKGRMLDTYKEHMDILHAMETGDRQNIYEITLRHMDVPRGINLEDL